jgi:hypothetical protein
VSENIKVLSLDVTKDYQAEDEQKMIEAGKAAGIRARLRSFVTANKGQLLRDDLETIASRVYSPKHSAEEYMVWIARNLPSFRRNHPQEQNAPFVLCMFSVASQHVYGDSIQECLDKAMG